MAQIFISYRRDDDPHAARNIYAALRKRFGKKNVYLDVEANRQGLDFRRQIDERLLGSDVMLVVIGDHWLQEDEHGHSRLDDETDFVRIEVAAALQRDIPVIPVLVGKAKMPLEEQLPKALHSLAFRHAAEVKASADFNAQIQRLVENVESAAGAGRLRLPLWAKAGSALFVVLIIGWLARELISPTDESAGSEVGNPSLKPAGTSLDQPDSAAPDGKLPAGSETAIRPMAALDDAVTTEEDVMLDINVLANDMNLPPAAKIGLNIDDDGTHGSVTVLDGNLVRYRPAPDFAGNDRFTYKIIGADGQATSAQVRIDVSEVNDTPESHITRLSLKYPEQPIFVLDVVSAASDADGEKIRLADFRMDGTVDEVRTALDTYESLTTFIGAFSVEEQEKLAGVLILPVLSWVQEEREAGNSRDFERQLTFVLEDERGASRSFAVPVAVEVGEVFAVSLACDRTGEGGPRRAQLDLMLDGQKIATNESSLSSLDDWGFSGFDPRLTVSDFLGDLEILATWESVSTSTRFNCESKLVVTGMGQYPLGSVSLWFNRQASRRENSILNTAMLRSYVDRYKEVYEELTGRPFDS